MGTPMSSSIRRSAAAGPQRASQRGQALVEMAVVIPVGLLLLLAVGYIGRAMLERQNMVAAARYAAREASLAAMRGPAAKFAGSGVIQQATGAGVRSRAVSEAMPGRNAVSAPPRWEPVTGAHLAQLQPRPLGAYGLGFVAQGSQNVEGKSYKFGIGFVLYGARAKERLTFLEPIRKAASGASRANATPARGLQSPLEVSAAAYMPGELPVHHPVVGLLQINPWIKEILEE